MLSALFFIGVLISFSTPINRFKNIEHSGKTTNPKIGTMNNKTNKQNPAANKNPPMAERKVNPLGNCSAFTTNKYSTANNAIAAITDFM